MNDPANSSDEELADSLSDSDDQAVAELVGRHAHSLYDFALRTTLAPDDAAEVTAAAFGYLRANAGERPRETSVRAWLFNFALESVLEVSGDHPAAVKLSSGDRRFTLTDEDEDIDREVALWAWQAAQSLRSREYGVLDLTVRRGLNPEELTGSATQGRGGVYATLSRASATFAEAYVATALYFRGRDACNDLSELVGGSGAAMRAGIRRQIASHVEDCETCQATLDSLPNASDVFRALLDVEPPSELRQQIIAAGAAAAVAAGQLSLDDADSPSDEAAEASDEESEAGWEERSQDDGPHEAEAMEDEPEEFDGAADAPVSEEELWARPEAEAGFAGVGASDLPEALAGIEQRYGAEPTYIPDRPSEVFAQYNSEYAEREHYHVGYAPAPLTLSERLSSWFAPSYGRSFVWSYALLGVSTAVAIYLGIAVADSFSGGGGASGAVPLDGGDVVREIACETGPISVDQGSTKVIEFDPDALDGFELDSVLLTEKPATATDAALVVEVAGATALRAEAAPVFSPTARTDAYGLQILWQRDDEDAVTDCPIVVNVPASTGPSPTPLVTGTPEAEETPEGEETPEPTP